MRKCNCKMGFVVLEFVEGCLVHKKEDAFDDIVAARFQLQRRLHAAIVELVAMKEMLKEKDQMIERFGRGDLPGEY